MEYRTVKSIATAEIEEKKSRFIGHVLPLGQFDQTLNRLRIEHRKANHHVTAFRKALNHGQVQEIGKDDGEPFGTAGMPVLKSMIGANLIDTAIIVTRYFGGTKLGTGGLARAYSSVAREAIRTASLVDWVQLGHGEFDVTFDQIAFLEQRFKAERLKVVNRAYTENGCKFSVKGDAEVIRLLSLELSNPK